MNINKLLIIHAIITLAAGIVLIAAPTLIPATVNIKIAPNEYLLCYFLGAAEIAMAYLSFFSSKIKEPGTLRLISSTFIIFHLVTGMVELYAFLQGVSPKILLNIILRILIVVLFIYYGYYKTPKQDTRN